MNTFIDLEIALEKLHKLQQEDGDIGAEYWHKISCLLKEASLYKSRALAAEAKLAEIERTIRQS